MRFFENKLSLAILLMTLPLLFLPKINLISIDSKETAGLRIDDMVLFFVGALLMWSHALSHQRLYKIEGWILFITGFSFLSFFSNRLLVSSQFLYMNAKIFYTMRLLEYFLFFYVGALASQYFRGSTIVRAFFLWNILLMTLQKLNLIGAISVVGYATDASSRVYGVASFPSEMGLIINFLFCYMIYEPSAQSRFVHLFSSPVIRQILRKSYLYWMFCLCGVFVTFTGNRISMVALLICFLFRLKQTVNWRSMSSFITLLILLPLLLMGIGFLITQTDGVYQRSIALFSFKNLELFQIVWDKVNINQALFIQAGHASEIYDMSWWLRIHKWLFVTKSFILNPECYLQGLGPGFMQSALDGGLLRIFTEYGLIGTFLFWKFFGCLYRLNQQTKWMMIAFLLNMIFFDAYLAYKTMSFLFFTCGYIFEKQHQLSRHQQPALNEKQLMLRPNRQCT